MSPAAGDTATPAAGTVMARPMIGMLLRPISFAAAPPSLPVAASRSGSLFTDRFDSNLHWYLPDYALVDDVDPGFAFAVRQTGQQANGQPFLVARLSLRLKKLQPAQVAQFAKSNPHAVLREIPLENPTAVLSSAYIDQQGNPQQRTFRSSSWQDQGDGSSLLVFDGPILGDSVLAVYGDLRTLGKAAIAVNGIFQCWSQTPPPRPLFQGQAAGTTLVHPVFSAAVLQRPLAMAAMAPAHAAPQPVRQTPVRWAPLPGRRATLPAHPAPLPVHPAPQPVHTPTPPPSPPPPAWVEVNLPYNESLRLGLKYNGNGYQLRYTLTTTTGTSQVILGADDLSSFSQRQTQFVELNELGDLNQKYPTLSRAYFGVLSKTIVLIPQRYAIVRSKTGCAATCLARVDSSSSSASQCAFDFSFMIAPEVSSIDLAKLTEDVSAHPDLNGYQITYADSLQTKPPSTVLTSFASSVQFAAGANPHTFALTITVQDGANMPAVANANLLILQLSAQSGTDLIGSLSLKLDDGYPDPVLATIDLNFAHTAGSDEILAQINQSSQTIQVSNASPLDLEMQNYALIQGANLTEVAGPKLISAGGSISLPLPANSDGLAFACEAELALPALMNATAVAKYLNFQTVDVQNTQYVVALDASGVDFAKVASVACTVTLPTLPSIAPWRTTLTANLKADSDRVQIPIENAVSHCRERSI